MERDTPQVIAEVRAALAAYETALVHDDVTALKGYFLDHPDTVRFGAADMRQGPEAIAHPISRDHGQSLARTLDNVIVSAFGADLAVVSMWFHRPRLVGKIGRETQTWVRTSDGWRIACAHISIVADPPMAAAELAEAEMPRAQRFRTLKAGRIILPGNTSTVDCTVRNRSETGLLLQLGDALPLPIEFEIMIDHVRRPVRVMRRKGLEVGVAFI